MAQAKRRKVESKPLFTKKVKTPKIKEKSKVYIGGGFPTLFLGMLIGGVFTALAMGYFKDPLVGLGSGLHNLIESTKRSANDDSTNQSIKKEDVSEQDDIEVKFDYYTVLPEIERLIPESPNQTAKTSIAKPTTAEKASAAAKAAEKVTEAINTEAATAATTTSDAMSANNTSTNDSTQLDGAVAEVNKTSYYILQAASYAQNADAEQLKAKLALSGRQAYIQKVTIDSKDYYRVRLGPFNDISIMKTAESELLSLGLKPLPLEVEKTE